jgi:small subunit ribosomal protein S17
MTQTQNSDEKTGVAAPVESRHKHILQGTVVSNKMEKTIVVKVDRRVRHGQYQKYLNMSKKYKAHDEKREAKVGDKVEIIESKPISRQKRWALRRVLGRN